MTTWESLLLYVLHFLLLFEAKNLCLVKMEKVLACFVLALLADVSASSGFGCVPDASGKEVALVRGVRNWNFLSNTARNMTSWIHQVELKRPSRESPFSTCRLRKELVYRVGVLPNSRIFCNPKKQPHSTICYLLRFHVPIQAEPEVSLPF